MVQIHYIHSKTQRIKQKHSANHRALFAFAVTSLTVQLLSYKTGQVRFYSYDCHLQVEYFHLLYYNIQIV